MRDRRCGLLVSWLEKLGCGRLAAPFASAQVRRLAVGAVALSMVLGLSVPVASGHEASEAGSGTGAHAAPGVAPVELPGEEIPQLRTRTSRTYQGEDGRLTARISSESVNFRDGAGWSAISNRLVDSSSSGYAVQNAANDYRVLFPEDLGGAPIRVSRGDAWVTFALRGASGRGVFDGAEARYADVLPGVSARYVVDNDAVKENLVFRDASTPSVAFDVAMADGLTPKAVRGAIVLLDRAGKERLSFSRPFLFDSRGFEVPASRLATRIERSGGGWRLTLSVDAGWLARATQDGPVTLDPQVNTGPGRDCMLDSLPANRTVSYCTDPFVGVGYEAADHNHTSLFQFDVRGQLPVGSEITRAWLKVPVVSSSNTSAQEVGAYRVRTAWTNSATWNTKDGSQAWDTAGGGGDLVAEPDFTTFIDGGYVGKVQTWAITDMARGWMTREFADYGVALRSKAQSGTNFYQLASSEATSGTRPYLDVLYAPAVGVKPFWTFAGEQQLSDRDSLKVNVASGNLVMQSNDVSVPGAGLDATFGRIYNSIPHNAASDLGNTWKPTGADSRMFVTYQSYGSEAITFKDETGANWHLTRQADGTYRAKGLKAAATRNADGTIDLVYDESRLKMRFQATENGYRGRRVEWVEDRNNNKITFNRDPSTSSVTSIVDTQGRTHTLAYGTSGPLVKVTDSSGRETKYDYTSGTQLGTYTDPSLKQMKFAYASPEWNVNDDLLEITDYEGRKTKIVYDARHRVTAITRITNAPLAGDGDTTTFAYAQTIDAPCDPAVHVGKTILTDPNGKSTTYCYDAQLRVTKSQDALGHVRDTAYDAQSNVTDIKSTAASTGTLGFNATFAFTPDGVIDKFEQGSGTGTKLTTSFQYDTAANGGRYQPSSTMSAQGNRTLFGYDARGNLTSSKLDQTGGSESTMVYGAVGKGAPTSSTDPDGNTTNYGYDAAGQLTSTTPPAGSGIGATTVTYDGLSRVKTVKDGQGQTRSYDYDLRDRIKKIAFADGSSTSFTYDGNGATLSRADAPAVGLLGMTTSIVDSKGRTVKETRPNGQMTEYIYDGADNLKSLRDAGGTTLYEYGPTNLLSTVQEPGVATPVRFEYNGDGNRAKAILPNNVTITSPYDQAGRLRSIRAVNGSGIVLQDLAYDYTKAGVDTELLQKVTDATPAGADNVTTYAYDGLDRLDTANTTGSNPSSYDYDLSKSGNRLREVRKDPGQSTATTRTYGYNPGNQLTSVNGSTADLAYDQNGNQTKSPTAGTIAYNARDQISGITPAGSSVLSSLVHAGTGQKDFVSRAGSTLQNDALGLASNTTGTSVTYYARSKDGGVISQRNSSTRRYMLTDERGSIVGLTDPAGTLTDTYRYDPYGRDLGTPHDTLGYAGGVRAPGNLTHFGARYYEAATGRWTQVDPLNQMEDLREANRYAYAAGDPVNLTDPSGCGVTAFVYCAAAYCGARTFKCFAAILPGRIAFCVAAICARGAAECRKLL